jgi:hypothetical protein
VSEYVFATMSDWTTARFTCVVPAPAPPPFGWNAIQFSSLNPVADPRVALENAVNPVAVWRPASSSLRA